MVAHLLQLKLDVLRNSLRRTTPQALGAVLGALVAIAVGVAVVASVATLQLATPEIARAVVVAVGTLGSLAFLIVPLAFGADDSLDPRKFSLFGLPSGQLAIAIALAALVSIPIAVLLVGVIANVAVWSANPGAAVVAIIGGILVIVMAVLAARVSSAVAAFMVSSRRARDAAGNSVSLLLALAAPLAVIVVTADWESQLVPAVRRIAAVAAWTPWGAPWSAAGDVALGRPGEAVLRLLIALVSCAALAAAWVALVRLLSERSPREALVVQRTALGWFSRVPATPGWAVAARSLSYWGRDPRYGLAVAAIPIVPIVVVAALLPVGIPPIFVSWIPVPVMCLFLGWLVHNDIAHDNTAFWAHIVAEVSGVADRWGRAIPALMLGIPLIVLGSVSTVWISGYWETLPGIIGLSSCLLLVSLGISSVLSATSPYATVHPGDSPFAQPQSDSASGAGTQALGLFGAIVLSSPVVLFMVFGSAQSPNWYFAALGAGLLIGAGVFAAGLALGGRHVSRNAPELLAFAMQN